MIIGSLTGCGFQLRKDAVELLPDELKVIKLDFQVYENAAALKNLFVDEWTLAGGLISDSDNVPVLLVNGERVIQRVLSVNPINAKVSEYSLKYVLSFQLTAPGNKKTLVVKTIHLQREYTVDTTNVLAKEYERKWLTNTMRQKAIKEIVRKLSHLDAGLFLETLAPEVPEASSEDSKISGEK
ncbi:MAG: LPS assembly lipoprotein LptE [Acidiferrobacterales bacterium]